jgi:hypothetical protein
MSFYIWLPKVAKPQINKGSGDNPAIALLTVLGSQPCLLLLRLDRHEPHRRSRHRLADSCRIVRTVPAAFEVGLHIARLYQPDQVAKRLQLAAQYASIPTRQRGNSSKYSNTLARLTRLRITTEPATSTPRTCAYML